MARKKPGSGDNYPSLFDQIKDQRAELLKEVARIEAELKRIYGASYKEALELAAVRRAIEQGGDFSWDANAAASSQLTKVLNNLQSATNALLSNSVVASWAKGEENSEKNLYAALGGGKAGKEAIQATAEKARSAMRERGATAGGYLTKNEGGFSISERVWKLTEDAKKELQIIIQNGIKEGKTPDEIARSAQQYLKEPAKLFRRVRDKATGNLELSKAAKEYHPGQGVYRSSYKNALRLARTEITAAYRRAEWESYQSNPLIIGYEIRLSNNHTTTLPNGKTVKLTDICDRMAGRYPKTFLWTGWHPQCRCVMIPITVSKEDFKARIKALKKGELQEWKPKETVTEMPAGFNDWIKDNAKRIQQAKARPYWITENYKGGDIKKGLIRAIASLKEEVKKQQEIITEFDSQIAMLERWKDALSLNLTEIYQLRTSGQRAALEAAVDKMTDEGMRRLNLWSEAGNELYLLQDKARKEGFNEIAASIQAVRDAYGSGSQPGKKYLACIAHLRNAKKDYEAALNEAIARKKAKLQPVKQPKELDSFLKEGDELDPEFFALIDPKNPIRLKVGNAYGKKSDAYYSPAEKAVYLFTKDRYDKSPWDRKAVIYHEFGHGLDYQRNLRFSPEVTAMRAAQIKRLTAKGKYTIYEETVSRNPQTGKWEYRYKVKREGTMMYAKYLENRMELLKNRLWRMPNEFFTSRGITKADMLEQFCSAADTLKSLVTSCGYGHSTSYMKQYGNSETEYMAHCFENAFVGNAVFKHFMPDIYKEMVDYIRTLKPGIEL